MIPFGFINVGATYQRMMNKLFTDMLGDTMDFYVDDMLVKSKKGIDHQKDLEWAFTRMSMHNVCLNP